MRAQRQKSAEQYDLRTKFALCHTRVRDHEEEVVEMLSEAGSGQPHVVVLRGFSGSGRFYTLGSAAYQASLRNMPTTVYEVDLGGFEPDMPLETYLRMKLGSAEGDEPQHRIVDGLRFNTKLPLSDVGGIALSLAFGLSTKAMTQVLHWLKDEGNQTQIPGSDLDKLRRLLKAVAGDDNLILSIPSLGTSDVTLGSLIKLTQLERLVLAVSEDIETAGDRALLRDSTVLEFQRLTRPEVEEWVERAFAGKQADQLAEFLWHYGSGYPGHSAGKLVDLLRDKKLRYDEKSGEWAFEPADDETALDFGLPFSERLDALTAELGSDLREIVLRAIVCGRFIPIGWVLDSMGITHQPARETLIDQIDMHLVDTPDHAFFIDHGYRHSGFPAVPHDNSVYEWTSELVRVGLCRYVRPEALFESAVDLRTTIQAHCDDLASRSALILNHHVTLASGDSRGAATLQGLLDWHVMVHEADALEELLKAQFENDPRQVEAAWRRFSTTRRFPPRVRLGIAKAIRAACAGLADEGSVPTGLPLSAIRHLRGEVAQLTAQAGDSREALKLLQALLPDCERVLGPDHPDTLGTRNNVASMTGDVGDSREALRLFQALLPDCERVLGPDDPSTLTTRSNIASWTGRVGDSREALGLFQALLPDFERVLGPDHPSMLSTRSNVASWTGEVGDSREALRLFQALLTDQELVLDPDDPSTLTTRGNIASWTGRVGDSREALRLLQALRLDLERVLGPDHPDTLGIRNMLASMTGEVGDSREALGLFQALLPDCERVLGPDHPDTLRTRAGVARWTGEIVDRGEALRLFEALLLDYERLLGPDNPDTLGSRAGIARWTGEVGDRGEALRLFEALLLDTERVLGPDHPDTLKTRNRIAALNDSLDDG